MNNLIPLVVILGPTAVGKSEVALRLAEQFTGEIVSADSRLFYRRMDIGTAKPTLEQRLRVPHHLIDVADPDEVWSLALFQREAHKAIQGIYAQKHLPFLVGGTGQFLRAIIEGWSLPSVVPDPRLRETLANWAITLGALELHHKLAILDSQAAQAIDPSNVRRTIRALEVILTSGSRFSDQKKQGQMMYNPLLLGLTCSRAELYRRVDERISSMISSGFVNEVKSLLEQGYSPDLPTMSAIGYREVSAYIMGKITLDEAVSVIKHRTRVFVRRQANWFKLDDPRICWFQADGIAVDEMGKIIKLWLERINWDFFDASSLKQAIKRNSD
ncbi:MAG TPA: tRNA (adenosine(37)-N6)-dimethylallyltransferase MiaA [Anaerolineales bacterium]